MKNRVFISIYGLMFAIIINAYIITTQFDYYGKIEYFIPFEKINYFETGIIHYWELLSLNTEYIKYNHSFYNFNTGIFIVSGFNDILSRVSAMPYINYNYKNMYFGIMPIIKYLHYNDNFNNVDFSLMNMCGIKLQNIKSIIIFEPFFDKGIFECAYYNDIYELFLQYVFDKHNNLINAGIEFNINNNFKCIIMSSTSGNIYAKLSFIKGIYAFSYISYFNSYLGITHSINMKIYIPNLKHENIKRDIYIYQYKTKNTVLQLRKNNINTMSIEELVNIPGIGYKTAKLIYEYILINRGIDNYEELLNIKGIGEKMLESIKTHTYLER